jgi:hypothetical protein
MIADVSFAGGGGFCFGTGCGGIFDLDLDDDFPINPFKKKEFFIFSTIFLKETFGSLRIKNMACFLRRMRAAEGYKGIK